MESTSPSQLKTLIQTTATALIPIISIKYVNTGDRTLDNIIITFITGFVGVLMSYIFMKKTQVKEESRFFNPSEIANASYTSADRIAYIVSFENILIPEEIYKVLLWIGKNSTVLNMNISNAVHISSKHDSHNFLPIYQMGKYLIYFRMIGNNLTLGSNSHSTLSQFITLMGKAIDKKINLDSIILSLPQDISQSQTQSETKGIITVNIYRGDIQLKTDGYMKNTRTFNELFFPDKKKMLNILDRYKTNTLYPSHIHNDKKLGFLLYGPPGTGKSAFVVCLANYLDKQVVNVNLSQIKTCPMFDQVLTTINFKNQILFMDELDCVMGVIRARSKQSDVENTYDDLDPEHTELMNLYINSNTPEHQKELLDKIIAHKERSCERLTLSHILQKLDGIYDTSDRIIIGCTNHLDLIDPALLRPGRLGIKVHMNYCTHQTVIDIICYYLSITHREDITRLQQQHYLPHLSPADLIQHIQLNYINREGLDDLLDVITVKP